MAVIDLAAIARANALNRRKVLLNVIELPAGIERDLLSIYMESVKAWAAFIRERLLPEYSQPAPLVQDKEPDLNTLQWLIDQAENDINNRVIGQTDRLGRWVTRTGEWHGARTISAAKSATGVDIAPFIRLGDIRQLLDQSIADNVSLIRGMNADTKRRVQQVIFDGFARRRNKRDITKELAKVMGITQRRARFIATDQAHKLQSLLTQYRNQQLGIEKYIWKTRLDERVRHLHRLREGKTYRWDKPPSDGHPGYPIMCRCSAQAVLWDEEDD